MHPLIIPWHTAEALLDLGVGIKGSVVAMPTPFTFRTAEEFTMDRLTDLKRLRELATDPAEIETLDRKIAACSPPAQSITPPPASGDTLKTAKPKLSRRSL